MRSLDQYIVVLENVVPTELCDSILTEYANSESWIRATTKSPEAAHNRTCYTIGMSASSIIADNPEVRKKLDHGVFECAAKVINYYNDHCSECKIQGDTGYELLRYETGQFYTQHTDAFKENPRAVSCSFALNDGYTGGEFAFFDRELKYSLKKGSVIMFPSNFMYPHEVMPVTSGTRYSIVTWFI